uniref:RNase_PH domain-containing protein n=1 Tax=Strongyloides papillosus TaxID=174720 RepID=A0A0N5C320_STREA
MEDNVGINNLMLKTIHPQKYYGDFLSTGLLPNGRESCSFEFSQIQLDKDAGGEFCGTATVSNSSSYVVGSHDILVRRNVQYPPCFSLEISRSSEKKQREHENTPVEIILTKIVERQLIFSFDQLLNSDKVLQFVVNSKIKYSGNPVQMLQSCLQTFLASLCTIEFPQLLLEQFAKDDVKIAENDLKFESDETKRLTLNDYPVATSLSLYEREDGPPIVVYDPPSNIKEFCSNTVTAIVGRGSKILYLSGGGSEIIKMDDLRKFIEDSSKFQQDFECQLKKEVEKTY